MPRNTKQAWFPPPLCVMVRDKLADQRQDTTMGVGSHLPGPWNPQVNRGQADELSHRRPWSTLEYPGVPWRTP